MGGSDFRDHPQPGSKSSRHQLATKGIPRHTVSAGFTKLCKGLAVVLLLGHISIQVVPSAATYLALIPARTIPFAWNLINAGYIEQTIPRVIVSIVGLLLFGKLLEPLWGAKELLKFIFIVNVSTSMCVFVTAIILYYTTQQEIYLYTPLSGFCGVLSGFLVGIKQILPDQELNIFVLKIKAKWIPSRVPFISVSRLEAGLKGDPSDEFAFSSFFPGFLRPILDPIASIIHKLLCGRSEAKAQSMDGLLPSSDSIMANRRRERGQRALEQRLAEKLAAVRSSESMPQQQEDASGKV